MSEPTQPIDLATLAKRLEQSELRVSELSKELSTLREQQITGVMTEGLVTHIAQQFQALFQNPVMVSSIASVLLATLQNALAFRAGHSKERLPQAMIVEHYIPGSQRVMLTGEGELIIEQQLKDSEGADDGWQVDTELGNIEGASDAVRDLMMSYSAEGDKYYYLTDDLTVQQHREDAARRLKEATEHREREMAIKAAEQQ